MYNCKYCNKNYNLQLSKWYHEQKCKIKDNNSEIELEKIKLENFKEEKEILKLKIKLQNCINNNTTNNNINNNIKISFCTEDTDTISKEDK
jgi:hypothetical protein